MEEARLNSELTTEHKRALAYHHKGHYEKSLAEKKAKDAEFKNTCKKAIADGVSVDDIKLLIQLDTPEGEAQLREELNRRIEVAKMANSEIGTQFSFLDEPDLTPINERAYEEGRVAGYKAASMQPPYQGEQEQEWFRGYHDGQQTLMAALDLTKAGIEEIRAAEEEAKAESAPKKRGRPKGSKNKNGHAAAPAKEGDPFAEEKAEDAAAFEEATA